MYSFKCLTQFLRVSSRINASPAWRIRRSLRAAGFSCTAQTEKRDHGVERKRQRLDEACLSLFPGHSKSKIQSWIAQGKVLVDNRPVVKAGTPVHSTAEITVTAVEDKAGQKLHAALVTFSVSVEGKSALDAGLSTGGFTDCLLQEGASHVVGVDVGYGQVADRVRTDPRVTVMERTNLRYLKLEDLPGGCQVDLVTLDLSFISVVKVLPAVCEALKPGGELIVLIKPQFEAGKDKVSAGGVVRDPAVHVAVVSKVCAAIEEVGFTCKGHMASPIKGATSGNTEFLAYFVRNTATDGVKEMPEA